MSGGYMDHAAGRAVLLELADVLRDLGVPFFLFQGTALGAVRDGGFCPTERDIDLGFLQEDLPPATAVFLLTQLVNRGFDVEAFVRPFTRVRTVVAWKGGVKADLVGLARWKGWRFTAQPVRSWCEDYALVYDAETVETYEPVGLFGRTFNVPSPAHDYLAGEYGDWRTPRDDHVSWRRVYNFLGREKVPLDLLEP